MRLDCEGKWMGVVLARALGISKAYVGNSALNADVEDGKPEDVELREARKRTRAAGLATCWDSLRGT